MSFKESTELAALPDRIDAKEKEREKIYAKLSDPIFLRDGAATAEVKARLASIESEVAALTNRWEELETIASS